MPLSQGDIFRVAARHKYSSIHDHLNVFHVIYDTAAVPNTAVAVLQDLASMIGQAYQAHEAHISNRLVAVDLAVYNITDDAPVGVTSWGGGYTGGTSGADGMPFTDAALALFYTATKRRIGKLYLGGLIEGDQSDGILSGTYLSSFGGLTAALLEMNGDENGGIYKYVVWSQQANEWSLPTTVHLQPLVASQDRRKPGRGS